MLCDTVAPFDTLYAFAQGQLQRRESRTGYREICAGHGNEVGKEAMEHHGRVVQLHREPIGCHELFEFVRNINGYGKSSVMRQRFIELPSPFPIGGRCPLL